MIVLFSPLFFSKSYNMLDLCDIYLHFLKVSTGSVLKYNKSLTFRTFCRIVCSKQTT
jgi:hypothetical protein